MIAWWEKREENEVAWRVKVGDLKKGFDLDVKNPSSAVTESSVSVTDCLNEMRKSVGRVSEALAVVEAEYRS